MGAETTRRRGARYAASSAAPALLAAPGAPGAPPVSAPPRAREAAANAAGSARPERRRVEALVGTQLGSCVLDRVLGVGGMSAVYLAHQVRPRRAVAVKVLRAPSAEELAGDAGAGQQFLARFRREANATAALDHANILPIFEFGEERGMAYLVMPYLAPGSLADVLSRYGTLSPEQTLTYVDQAAAALDYAHGRGIVHRDVKPSNFLLHPDGRLLLADFGIARTLPMERTSGAGEPQGAASDRAPHGDDAPLTLAGSPLGTPEYMAPEQILGEPVSAATDVYALGVVAYALLTGHPPFGGEVSHIFARTLHETPRPLRDQRPDVPPRIADGIHWALAKLPEERPPSASALAAALHGAGDRPGLAPRYVLAAWQPEPDEQATQPMAGMGSEPGGAPGGDLTLPDRWEQRRSAARGVPAWPLRRLDGGGAGGGGRRRRPVRRLLGVAMLALAMVAMALAMLAGGLAEASRVLGVANTSASPPMAANGTATTTLARTPAPTIVPSPTATMPAEGGGMLSLAPSSVILSCAGSLEGRVVLQNTSTQAVEWQARAQPPHSGVRISPENGRLNPGERVVVTLRADSRRVLQQGTIVFQPQDASAGNATTLTYTTVLCG